MSDVGPPAASDIFTDNHRWGDLDDWNRTAVELHGQGGIHRVERDGFDPFWAVIDHAAVLDIERQPDLFTNGPEPVLTTIGAREARGVDIKTLIHMDAPQHMKYRQLTADWFRPASVKRLDDRLTELSHEAVAKLEAAGGEVDFATEIALTYPLQVILRILGLPEDDFPRMMTLTQELFGGEDPDLQREPPSPEVAAQVLMDFYTYFTELTVARRAEPTDDLASLIANAKFDGEYMPRLDANGYYIIVATAGHDTTSASTAGGVLALIENTSERFTSFD